jgi:hypothetical protein
VSAHEDQLIQVDPGRKGRKNDPAETSALISRSFVYEMHENCVIQFRVFVVELRLGG